MLLCVVLSLVLLPSLSLCGVFSGSIVSSPEPTAFLARFCLGITKTSDITSTVILKATPTDQDNIKVGIFLDSDWENVYKDRKVSCKEFQEFARTTVDLDPGSTTEKELALWETQRPHFWYAVASACGSKEHTINNLSYRIEFLNSGSPWEKQFGNDEVGMLEASFAFFILLFALNITHWYGLSLWHRQLGFVHPILKLMSLTVLLGMVRFLLLFVHECLYLDDGIGAPWAVLSSQVLHVLSQIIFLVTVIVVARGWAVSNRELSGRGVIAAMAVAFTIGFVLLFLYDFFFSDPASTRSLYESTPGYIIIALRLLTFGWFILCLRETYSDEYDTDKMAFYRRFGFICSVWFLSLPISVGVSALLSPWVRAITTFSIYSSLNVLIFACLVYILWPREPNIFRFRPPASIVLDTAWDSL